MKANYLAASLLLAILVGAIFEHGAAFTLVGWFIGAVGVMVDNFMWKARNND